MNIYVGNMSYDMTEGDLNEIFGEFGDVSKACVISDRDTGRAKGFGFVEMDDNDAAAKAIEALDGKDIQGRNLRVNEAKPREDRPRRERKSW